MGPCASSLSLAFSLLAIATPPKAPADISKSQVPASNSALVGAWRLVSYVDTPEGGEPTYPFGREPIGQFLFTADGQVSINIMRNPPEPWRATGDIDPDACLPAWYCSYFGTYTVAADKTRWMTHVLGGNIPSFIGTDQTRSFRIEGDRLILTESYRADGTIVHAERVLTRSR